MAKMVFLLDTNIVSLAGLRKPPPTLRPWLKAVGANSLALSFPVISELRRGAHLAAATNPEKAQRLTEWIDAILSVGFQTAQVTNEYCDLYAKMTVTPQLRGFMAVNPNQKRPRLSHDLMIAALAIANSMPIATCDRRDFALIDNYFPLPGVFDPPTPYPSQRYSLVRAGIGG